MDFWRRRKYHREQVKGNSTSDCLRQLGLADGLSLASPRLGTPWVRLKLSAILRNLRNLSREFLPYVCSQAVLFITFSQVLYLHVLSCRQSLSPAIHKTSVPAAQITLRCSSSQLSQFLTECDKTRPCQFMSTAGPKVLTAMSVSRVVVV